MTTDPSSDVLDPRSAKCWLRDAARSGAQIDDATLERIAATIERLSAELDHTRSDITNLRAAMLTRGPLHRALGVIEERIRAALSNTAENG